MAQSLDVTIQGQALLDFGFEALGTISGIGLITRGFLWPCSDIWGPAEDVVHTIWTPVPSFIQTVEACIDGGN